MAGLLDDPEEIVKRGSVLPLGRTRGGDLRFAMPSMLMGLLDAAAMPGQVASGKTPLRSVDLETGETVINPKVIEQSADLAGMAVTGSMPFAQAGAVGSGGGKLTQPGIRAYHGSPHDFDRFDMSKIGTGEGNQVYGHGLYFAENEAVAKGYRDSVKDMASIQQINARLQELSKIMDGDKAGQYRTFKSDVGRQAAREYDELMDARSDVLNKRGHMYEVNINADPARMLDWDAPLAQQPPHVQDALRRLGMTDPNMQGGHATFRATRTKGFALKGEDGKWGPGPDSLDAALAAVNGDSSRVTRLIGNQRSDASAALLEAGIPGIRYLDAGSRAAGEGSRNYVIFDDSLIEIMRKYGLVGLLGAGALGASSFTGNSAPPET